MPSYTDLYRIATGQPFLDRVTVAITAAAITVQNEDPATPNHDARSALAYRALRDPAGSAGDLALGIAHDTALQADKDNDTLMLAAVLDVWDAYAGVTS